MLMLLLQTGKTAKFMHTQEYKNFMKVLTRQTIAGLYKAFNMICKIFCVQSPRYPKSARFATIWQWCWKMLLHSILQHICHLLAHPWSSPYIKEQLRIWKIIMVTNYCVCFNCIKYKISHCTIVGQVHILWKHGWNGTLEH